MNVPATLVRMEPPAMMAQMATHVIVLVATQEHFVKLVGMT